MRSLRARLVSILVPALMTLGFIGAAAASAPGASASAPIYNVCHDNGNGTASCLNNRAGLAENDNPVQYWAFSAQGEPNNDWNAGFVGYVNGSDCTSNCWPFVAGSGMNAKYNGNPVYELIWEPDTGYCADSFDYYWPGQSGDLRLASCNPASNSQWFVYSSSHFLVSVNASNLQYVNYHVYQQPVWLGEVSGTGNGQSVGISPAVDQSETFGFDVPHVR